MSMRARGLFVSLEGGEGAGKSTVLADLHARLTAAGHAVLLTREPGGTPLGERLRRALLDTQGDAPVAEAEALLFCAARAHLVNTVLRPALARGTVVLCDRYADSTLAYQGYGRGLPLDQLRTLNALATGGLRPDLTLLLDLPVAEGIARRRGDSADMDRLDREASDFHERVRTGFRDLATLEPERWVILDARRKPGEVAAEAWSAVAERLGEPGESAQAHRRPIDATVSGQAPGAAASSRDSAPSD
jgi:dTMP kinase